MDAFLSGNRRDATQPSALNARLGSKSATTFFDQRDLGRGKLWLPALDRRIEHDAQAVAVLVGPVVSATRGNTVRRDLRHDLVGAVRAPPAVEAQCE